MSDTKDIDRYEKRGREIAAMMNRDISEGKLIAGSKEYSDLDWLMKTLFKASKTYKKD